MSEQYAEAETPEFQNTNPDAVPAEDVTVDATHAAEATDEDAEDDGGTRDPETGF